MSSNQNIALIFAGGVGNRMRNGSLPKQFLELDGKPIIIYTLEKFEYCKEITDIVVVCVNGWEKYLSDLINNFNLHKIRGIVLGGRNPQESQYNGLKYINSHMKTDQETVVLLHDGVRPLVDEDTIIKNIKSVRKYGSAITVTPAIETIVSEKKSFISKVARRNDFVMGKAPQSYYFNMAFNKYTQAYRDRKTDFIDSASLMFNYGVKLATVNGSTNNIKITTPVDYYIFKGIKEAQKQENIFGI